MYRAAVVAGAVIMLSACSAPVESTDFPILVPDGTREIEYAAAPVDEREQQLELARELVISRAFDVPFYGPRDVAIATNGDIFVLDGGNARVVVFDREGSPLRQFGRSGQGPGEFQSPNAIALVGNQVVVYQRRQRRINVFSTEGVHLEDHALEESLGTGEMVGLDDVLVVVNASGTPLPIRAGQGVRPVPWLVGVYTIGGSERRRLIETQDMARARFLTGAATGPFPIAAPHPRAAIAPDGLVYATSGGKYEVLAVEPAGAARWLLRVDSVPEIVTEAHKDQVAARVLEGLPGGSFVEVSWPDRFAAIVNLEVDGNGNLYAFPYDPDVYFEPRLERQPPSGRVPVDVYSPGGERLMAGWIDLPHWDAQGADRICRIEPDPESDEEVVACYRLVLPGQ